MTSIHLILQLLYHFREVLVRLFQLWHILQNSTSVGLLPVRDVYDLFNEG